MFKTCSLFLFSLFEFASFFFLSIFRLISLISRWYRELFLLFFSYLILFVHLFGWWVVCKHTCILRAIFSFRSPSSRRCFFYYTYSLSRDPIGYSIHAVLWPVCSPSIFVFCILYTCLCVQNPIYCLYICAWDLIRNSKYE